MRGKRLAALRCSACILRVGQQLVSAASSQPLHRKSLCSQQLRLTKGAVAAGCGWAGNGTLLGQGRRVWGPWGPGQLPRDFATAVR
jgi:hypothetical protein